MIKKRTHMLAVLGCGICLAAAGAGAVSAQAQTILAGGSAADLEATGPGAQTAQEELLKIWGTVTFVNGSQIGIDNQSGVSYQGELVLNTGGEDSRVLDAENGFPVQLSDIQAGDTIYAYIGQAMTMSLPPQTAARMIICKIPADAKAPDYVTVDSMVWHENGDWTLTGADGTVWNIPADCPIIPYLTRNMVTLADVEKGSQVLLWSDGQNNGQKLVLFP